MKKTLAIFLPAFFLVFLFSANQVSAVVSGSSSIDVTNSSTIVVMPPVAIASSSLADLPDFEITEITTKESTESTSTKDYYVTVVNRGSDYILSTEKVLALSFFADEASYYSVGNAGETFAKDQEISVGPLAKFKNNISPVAIINPLFSVSEKKYNNNFFQKEVAGGVIPPATSLNTSTPPKSTSTPPAVEKPKFDFKKEGGMISLSGTAAAKLELLVKELKKARDNKAMADNMTKYTNSLKKQFPKEKVEKLYAINNFITYGTASTAKLTAKDRFNLVAAFVKANKKLPATETDWTKILEGKK